MQEPRTEVEVQCGQSPLHVPLSSEAKYLLSEERYLVDRSDTVRASSRRDALGVQNREIADGQDGESARNIYCQGF